MITNSSNNLAEKCKSWQSADVKVENDELVEEVTLSIEGIMYYDDFMEKLNFNIKWESGRWWMCVSCGKWPGTRNWLIQSFLEGRSRWKYKTEYLCSLSLDIIPAKKKSETLSHWQAFPMIGLGSDKNGPNILCKMKQTSSPSWIASQCIGPPWEVIQIDRFPIVRLKPIWSRPNDRIIILKHYLS